MMNISSFYITPLHGRWISQSSLSDNERKKGNLVKRIREHDVINIYRRWRE